MQKHFESIDDYDDHSESPMIDWVGWLLDGIFVGVGSAMLGYTLFLLITAYLKW